MRAQQAITAAARILPELLDGDVAEAIVSDTGPFEAAARIIGQVCSSERDLRSRLQQITNQVDDGLADWLVDRADSPGAWFCKQAQQVCL